MNVTCSYCGHVATKATMIKSKYTGNGYCMDDFACAKRKSQQVRGVKNERSPGRTT